MDFLQFLEALERTLRLISISGREDTERMCGIYGAIDDQRKRIENAIREQQEQAQKEAEEPEKAE